MREVVEVLQAWIANHHPQTMADADMAGQAAGQPEPRSANLSADPASVARQSSDRVALSGASDEPSSSSVEVFAPTTNHSDESNRDSHAVETVASQKPNTVTDGEQRRPYRPSVAESNGEIELGIEVFANDASSQGARLQLEERRARAQRRDRVTRWIWSLAIALFVLIILLFAVHSFFSRPAQSPQTPAGYENGPPEIVPRR